MEQNAKDKKAFLQSVAHLVWWKSTEEALLDVPYLLRQVMTYGNLNQCLDMEALFSQEELVAALQSACAGQMTGSAWHFWHYRLTHCAPGTVPPMPVRPIPGA